MKQHNNISRSQAITYDRHVAVTFTGAVDVEQARPFVRLDDVDDGLGNLGLYEVLHISCGRLPVRSRVRRSVEEYEWNAQTLCVGLDGVQCWMPNVSHENFGPG